MNQIDDLQNLVLLRQLMFYYGLFVNFHPFQNLHIFTSWQHLHSNTVHIIDHYESVIPRKQGLNDILVLRLL